MASAPYPSLRIRFAVPGYRDEVPALVDTGFDGHLAIPQTLTARIPQPTYVRRVRTASGQVVRVPVYLGTIEFVDQPGPRAALIIAIGDEYLVGLEALNPFRVIFDHGQRVAVEP